MLQELILAEYAYFGSKMQRKPVSLQVVSDELRSELGLVCHTLINERQHGQQSRKKQYDIH